MNVLVGVDSSTACRTTALLAARLAFKAPRAFELVHVVEPLAPAVADGLPPDPTWLARALQDREALGREALRMCEETLRAADVSSTRTSQRTGNVALEIVAAARDGKADLIAAGCSRAGLASRLFYGSVTRKLLSIAPCSLLLGKADVLPERPLKALFATDHSTYAGACVDVLARLAPAGIGELTVFTAQEPNPPRDFEKWVGDRLTERNEAVMARLATLPAKLASRFAFAPPVEGIRAAMDASGADLLIVGAHGHGFFDRLLLGSVSYELAMNDRRPVLVLRT